MGRATGTLHSNKYIDELDVRIDCALFDEGYLQGIQNGFAVMMVLWQRFKTCDDENFLHSACKKSFNQLGHLIIFERIHKGKKPYACKICDKSFSRNSILKIHDKIHARTD